MTTDHLLLPGYTSHIHTYVTAWVILLFAFVVAAIFFSLQEVMPYFLLASCILGALVFHFEYARYSGFLKAHYPAKLGALQGRFLFRVAEFYHPALWKELFLRKPANLTEYEIVRRHFRATFIFSSITFVVPMVLLVLVL